MFDGTVRPQFHIVGAGLTGLIAGHAFAGYSPVILEAQKSLPDNHGALLRFRSNAVAEATGLRFRSGTVRKAIVAGTRIHNNSNIQLANMYSRKVTGGVSERSIWSLDPALRWVAPPDFCDAAASRLKIMLDYPITSIDQLTSLASRGPVISTIPMPAMMELLDWKDRPAFNSQRIWTIEAVIKDPPMDVYQTLYFPEPDIPFYRASLTGNRLIVEFIREPPHDTSMIPAILSYFGVWPVKYDLFPIRSQRFGKIVAIDEDLRREFIYTLTREFGVYSLGRFATWRQILLDDVVSDCDVIEKLIGGESRRRRYAQSLTAVKG